MKGILTFLQGNWLDILLVLVGFSAFITYFWQKKDSKRAAATLLKSQIDAIEKAILALKNDHQLGNQSIYNSGKIMNENLWEKYKHIFVKELSQSETEIIQRFFDCAEQIERTRADITKVMLFEWEQHGGLQHDVVWSLIFQNIILNDVELSKIQIDKEKWNDFENSLDGYNFGYLPGIIVESLVKSLENFTNLSGTTAYAKIQKSSFEK